jgi:subtilisin
MRIASICVVSALALAFVHSHALAQSPPPTPRPNQSELEQARNTYIFQFNPRVPQAAMSGLAHRIVGEAGGSVRHVYTNVIGGFAATLPGAAVWNVAGKPEITSYERDEIFTVAAKPVCPSTHPSCKDDGGGGDGDGGSNDGGGGGGGDVLNCPNYGEEKLPWGVKRINAPGAHSEANCGQGIHVYVIDTGIDLDHPSLTPVGNSVTCGKSCSSGGDDNNGHGTHVAGTIGARGQDVVGVAPAVFLHSVKVLKGSGIGFLSDIIAGIDWVAGEAESMGVPVVANMSLGGSGKREGKCENGTLKESSNAYRRATCEAAGKGVVLVVAAGNSGADAENYAPASHDDAVITVSATEQIDCRLFDGETVCDDGWTSWSNWGDNSPPQSWAGPDSAPVAIAAPGGDILSTKMGGGTTTMSGTSMASPHVAGVAALILMNSTASGYSAFLEVRTAILGSAEPAGNFKDEGDRHAEGFVCADGC